MNEYLFDVKLFAAIRVKAASEAEATATLKDMLDSASCNLVAFPSGDPILCEASIDGDPDLVEINGEFV